MPSSGPMTNDRFAEVFDGPPRRPESKLTQREMDLAASVQAVTEEAMLRTAHHVHAETGMKNLCLAGGVALNCVGNGRILREGPFENIWIQPAAGDSGGALGVALLIWHQLLGNERKVSGHDSQQGSLLGPSYSRDQIRDFLDEHNAVYELVEDEDTLCGTVADLIASEKVIGWFQGRMEIGPRALGARSILANPAIRDMKDKINAEVKYREAYRPFAPSSTVEAARDFFDIEVEAPFMLKVCDVRPEKRDVIPAVTHVDGSARLQTVRKETNPLYHALITHLGEHTGVPVVLNTSFNIQGEPVVESPRDAIRCFFSTGLDVLAIGSFTVHKRI